MLEKEPENNKDKPSNPCKHRIFRFVFIITDGQIDKPVLK
jgi:hypothetical protein